MSRYVGLLRGTNVGGTNLIKMIELKACFEKQGFRDVATYIQSGNVLFTSAESGRVELIRRIEAALGRAFSYGARIVLRSRREMRDHRHARSGWLRSSPDQVPLRRHLPGSDPHGAHGHEERAHPAGRGPGARRERRALLLTAHQQGVAEPPQPPRLTPRLSEHDHPQLEHDHHAAPADGWPGQ
jgi:hypothetical protein